MKEQAQLLLEICNSIGILNDKLSDINASIESIAEHLEKIEGFVERLSFEK